jgi:hypothetical protein
MTRAKWKCPHEDCDVETGRRWNLERHIRTVHRCDCCPVKRSSNLNKSLLKTEPQRRLDHLTSSQVHIHSNRYYPYFSSSDFHSFDAHDLNMKTATDANDRYGRLVDIVYPIFKKLARRNDKIFEMRDYFRNHGSDPGFPPLPPLEVPGHSEIENTLAPTGSAKYSGDILTEHKTPSQSAPKQKKVIGFELYTCGACFESESLPFIYDPNNNNRLSKAVHLCDPQKADNPKFFREGLSLDKIHSPRDKIMQTTKEWARGKIFLVSFRVSLCERPKGAIHLEMKDSQYGWVKRAIEKSYTTLDETELREFFTLTDCVTFCCISPNYVEQLPQKTRQESYYFFLNYKPCSPFEN